MLKRFRAAVQLAPDPEASDEVRRLRRRPRQHVLESNRGGQVSDATKHYPSLLTMRPNKLDCFSLETLSRQVLEFEGKARANPIGEPFRHFLLG